MTVQEIYQKIKASPEYAEWNKENPKAYLVHFLYTSREEDTWQVGFYEKDKKEMTSFEMNEGTLIVRKEKDIFRKDDNDPILPLIVEDVKNQLDEVAEQATTTMKQNYKNELPMQGLYILQNLKDFGIVWNATIFTKSFKTMNVKINAATGEVKSHELAKLFDFEKGDKGIEGNKAS